MSDILTHLVSAHASLCSVESFQKVLTKYIEKMTATFCAHVHIAQLFFFVGYSVMVKRAKKMLTKYIVNERKFHVIDVHMCTTYRASIFSLVVVGE